VEFLLTAVTMRVLLSAALIVVAAGQVPPAAPARLCSPENPCAPPPVGPTPAPAAPTAAPTLPPRTIWVPYETTPAPKPVPINVLPVCVNAANKFADPMFPKRKASFTPWVVYKYLKANGPFIQTVSKDQMGGQTLKVQNAGVPLQVADFTCIKEGNEWKARVLDEAINKNLLTIKLFDGWCDNEILTGNFSAECLNRPPIEKCLLQDISLYRAAGPSLGLRLDYGNCPISAAPETRLPGTKKAIIMVGLKRVPDSSTTALETPNLKGFFEDVCDVKNPAALPATTQFDLTKAKAPNANGTCFAATADMEDISALDQMSDAPCFNDAVVWTLLDVNNRFPVLPVMDSDYAWLLSKLPAPDASSVCDEVPHQVLGQVKMDRVCVHFEGLQDVTCANTCGKICNSTFAAGDPTMTTTPPIPPAICIDCEAYEIIYALIATCLVVMLSYYTYLSNSLSWVATWFFVPLEHASGQPSPHEFFGDLQQSNMTTHNKANKHLYWPATLGLLAICGVWSFIIYYAINILDMLGCWLIGMEQCVRVWGFQYMFDESHYLSVNGTYTQMREEHLTLDERGRWIWPLVGPRRMINIDWCPGRLLPMIFATWLSAWFLMCWWRSEQKISIMKTTIKQEIISEEQGLMTGMSAVGGTATGAGGMLTKTLAFFGGGYVPPP